MREKVKSELVLGIEDKIKDILAENNFSLVDINLRGGNNKILTIFIFNDKNTGTGELENISKLLLPIIDNMPYFKDKFLLEVSSPGLFREIKYREELNIFRGRNMKIVTDKGEVYSGISLGLNGDIFKLKDENNNELEFDLKNIIKVKLNG